MKKWCEPTWRKPEDTDFSRIQDYEVAAASLWEMLRALSPDKLKSLGGIHGAAALRMLKWVASSEDPKLAKMYGMPSVPLAERWPRRTWTELSVEVRQYLVSAVIPPGASIIDGETVASMNEFIDLPRETPTKAHSYSMLEKSPFDPSTVPKDPPTKRPNYEWDLSKKPEHPAEQRVGLTIDWSKGLAQIRRDIEEWLTDHAPPGTPGNGPKPKRHRPVESKQKVKPFRATLDYISCDRLRKMGESPKSIRQSFKDQPSLFKIRDAKKNLQARYHEWLGVTFS